MELTNSELAILSLIAEEPRHGYQIEQVIKDRNMRSWTEIGFSSIYRILNKLEKAKLTEGRPGHQEGRGPARKVYHITKEGQEIWRKASLNALSSPSITASTFLIGLDNIYDLDPDEAIKALRTYLQTITMSRDFLADHLQSNQPMHFYTEAFFDYMITKFQADIDWINKFIKQMIDYNAAGLQDETESK